MAAPLSVSVIIPAYNAAPFVAETVESALDNDCAAPVEIVVVDDGSTDATREVLQAYAGRIQLFSTPNRGASAARQLGMEKSSGSAVIFLDADDILARGAISRSLNRLARSGADVVCSSWQRLEWSGDAYRPGKVITRSMQDVNADPEIALFEGYWAPPGACCYTRRILRKMPPWNPRLPIIQDARFALEAAFAGARFVHEPEVGLYYRVSRDGLSLSRRDRPAFLRDYLVNAIEVEAIWRMRGPLDEPKKAALADVYGRGALYMLRQGALAGFREAYARFRPFRSASRPSRLTAAGWVSRLLGARSAQRSLQVLDGIARLLAPAKRRLSDRRPGAMP